jgi:hypothetical protein
MSKKTSEVAVFLDAGVAAFKIKIADWQKSSFGVRWFAFQ